MKPESDCSVKSVGGVTPAGLVLLRKPTSTGLAVSVVLVNTTFGVVPELASVLVFCRIAAKPVRDMPLTRRTVMICPVEASAGKSAVTVCATAVDSVSATNAVIRWLAACV